MPAMSQEQFTKLNLMAGTARSLEQEIITGDDSKVWERDFDLLVNDLTKLVDPELGNDLRAEKGFYDAALQVAKGYFDKNPFGGLKSATGQFGFRLISPQDFKTDAEGATPAFYSWVNTIATVTSGSYAASGYLFGRQSVNNVYIRNAANKKAVIAFHRLISYKPSPRVIHVMFNINDYPYVPYTVEPFSKISKENKLFKVIPMPGRVILHPGGKLFINLFFDLLTGTTGISGSSNVDIEIAPFGIIFGQYDYLASSELT